MKWLLIGFIIIQVGIDLTHSVTVFPFVHYGMFSERFPRPDSLNVFEVSIDGRRLEPSEFRVYRWDMITGPLQAVDRLKSSDDFAFDRENSGNIWGLPRCIAFSSPICRTTPMWPRVSLIGINPFLSDCWAGISIK
ncbi:hypothetical protein ACQ86N_16310 [Puia sp. P3]|uniref:hypothetical protein n=1 Tax=Puia sp. P3 TaxID=3423952 RepID=UPI003D67ACB8